MIDGCALLSMSGVTASRVMVGSPAAALLAFALHCCVRERQALG